MQEEWYAVNNTDEIDSPALLVYPDRIIHNLNLISDYVDNDLTRLRPHVKTNKIKQVCELMMAQGIMQFKCSTIAEAEMLGMAGAQDVLLAYPLIGPKQVRFIKLMEAYPNTHFSCLVDHRDGVVSLADCAQKYSKTIAVYMDVDLGMGRTGVSPDQVMDLYKEITQTSHLPLEGVHGYDGHISDPDVIIRQSESQMSYTLLRQIHANLQELGGQSLKMVIGGSPSFSSHARHIDAICSPGTFVFWDWGYKERLVEQAFVYAAVLLTRVISVIDDKHICVDLGYKSVASENPLPRALFLNAVDAKQEFQSEEHLVLSVDNSALYPIGTVLYAVPRHICPTVALYESVNVIENRSVTTQWNVIARDRKINI